MRSRTNVAHLCIISPKLFFFFFQSFRLERRCLVRTDTFVGKDNRTKFCREETIGRSVLAEQTAVIFHFQGAWVSLSLKTPNLDGNYKILRTG